MIDNHTHLDLIDEPLESIISRAKTAGVDVFVVPGICGFPEKLEELLRFPEIKICWGIFPKFAKVDNIFETKFIELLKSDIKIVAIGECGLDRRFPNIKSQIELFKKQIRLAIDMRLPLIVHLVGHYKIAYDLLSALDCSDFMLHSWSGSVEMAKEFIELGGKISLSAGILRNASKLRKLLRAIPEEKIFFETDSPDQKPEFCNKPFNEPAFLPEIIKKIKSHGLFKESY